ncbi:MAG: NAD(P)/FAD-dependent oxidoreductase [Caulobacteraceae bacterium]
MDRYAVVIGAGVIGLACAVELARRGREVLVLESEAHFGSGVSSRSSEVAHGGMYYPPGSLRAKHCVQGRRMLYAFCQTYGVAHRRCGKLIVAVEDGEAATLDRLHVQARANGVEGLELLSGAQAMALEPALRCQAALLSPETGIVDSHGLMLALVGVLEASGGALALGAPVRAIRRRNDGFLVEVGGREPCEVEAELVVNAAGLASQSIAAVTEDYDLALAPRLVPTKGNYFGCSRPSAFSRLIYPVPVEGGLGVHLTFDLAGRMRFGPDVQWGPVDSYAVDPARADAFYVAIRRYWPALPSGALYPDYAGVRPKLTGPGEASADFDIQGGERHGLAGLVHLFGIESPGLTSSLSLAVEVAERLPV